LVNTSHGRHGLYISTTRHIRERDRRELERREVNTIITSTDSAVHLLHQAEAEPTFAESNAAALLAIGWALVAIANELSTIRATLNPYTERTAA
jgi:hypothetical protein